MKNKKVKFYTLGCKVNHYDSDFLLAKLEREGFKKTNKDADLAIINSCAVTKTAIRKDRQMIVRAKKENPKAKIILMGCWSEVYRDEIDLKEIDLIWGTGESEKLLKQIKDKFFRDFDHQTSSFLSSTNLVSTDRTRYFLKIQDGCEQFCSYCIIPFTRGKLRSRNEKDILKESEEALRKGFKEIVLTGIHIGLYGKEKDSVAKVNLDDLVEKIFKTKHHNLKRLRLSSIEVTEVSDKLIELMKKNKNFCPHLHISLQSGSNKILKLMNRPYSAEYFYKKVKEIREIIPDIAISTDIIVGFPGETEENFQETLNFVNKIKFSKIHVFPYSAHEKTRASNFLGQLSREEILNRSRILRKISLEQENNFKDKFNSKELEILVEHIKEEGLIMGRTKYYFDVLFKKDDIVDNNKEVAINNIVNIKVIK